VIIYTVAGVCGFSASTLAFLMPFLPGFLRGAGFTVGASAPIFGLIGALLYYGRRGGSSHIGQQAKSLAITMLVFGFVMPGVDNWAHLGGLGGGYLAARILDPLKPERGNHVLAAVVCLVVSLLAVAVSVVKGLAILR
jgi:rhomboid protease GluP